MQKPRSSIAAVLGAAVMATLLGSPRESAAQASFEESKIIAQLAAEIAAQQAAILENQKMIDAKLAAIAENLRIARIYVSRGGGPAPK
jgi:hypothetical protein